MASAGFRKGYAEEDTLRVLELPYAGRELSMVVLLPKKVDGLPELEKAITLDKLAALRAKLRVREVNACLPKFKLETSFGLTPTLEAMGVKRAFSRAADFLGISSVDSLYISAVPPQGVRGRQRGGHGGCRRHGRGDVGPGSTSPAAGAGVPRRSPLPVPDP